MTLEEYANANAKYQAKLAVEKIKANDIAIINEMVESGQLDREIADIFISKINSNNDERK